MESQQPKTAEIPTKCEEWSLNENNQDSESPGKRFLWNKTYSISIWADQLNLNTTEEMLDDFAVWRAFIQFQASSVYKLCAICNGPETAVDMKICCTCGATVHVECSEPCSTEQIAQKPANKEFEPYLVCCFACEDKMPQEKLKFDVHEDDARRAAVRTMAISDEIGPEFTTRCHVLTNGLDLSEQEKILELQNINAAFFQPGNTLSWLERKMAPNKAGARGTYAAVDIPRFSIVGVYPGYEDLLIGEHIKKGRPIPIYKLRDINCADYYNRVFIEHDKCFTQFINEPNENEESNVAWIQETCHKKGRISVIAVRDIRAGEELLISYGPVYRRTYPFNYDAYALSPVDGYENPPCFALWHWKNKDKKDAEFVCYIAYDSQRNIYTYWETAMRQLL
ncbi:MAG: SET domain-containing protein [Deltaproteobacteria bacterium]|nr:SET domain-containing protein [Deltaproteobacteria bacterium]